MMYSSGNAEASARAALEARAGRALTGAEWEGWRTRLVEFATILWHWTREAEGTKECRLGKVGTRNVDTSESIPDEAA
jgi:hypothetical protein